MSNDRFTLYQTIVSYYIKRPFHVMSNGRFTLLKETK